MMPSRGVAMAAVRGGTARLFQLQCRRLSSAPQRPLTARIPLRRQHIYPPSCLLAVRHGSTSAILPPASTPPYESTPDFPNLDTINIDVAEPAPLALAEGIGYLHSLGVNHGFGPTSAIQWTLEHYHVWGGLPWWMAIAATALTLRLAILPLYIRAADNNARESALVSVTQPFARAMTAAQKTNDQQAIMQAWSQLVAVRRRAGVTYLAALYPLVAQGVIGFCGFRLLRECATVPVPTFVTGGFGHLTDLTLSDPYLLLPLAMAAGIHLIVRLGGESGAINTDSFAPAVRIVTLYAMPALIFVIMGFQPGALCIWFTTTGAMGIAQATLLRSPRVREALGIAPIYKPTAAEAAESPMAQLLAQLSPSKPTVAAKGHARRPSLDVGPKSRSQPSGVGPTWQAPSLHTGAGTSSSNRRISSSPKAGVIDVRGRSVSGGADTPAPSPGVGAAVKAVKGLVQGYVDRKKIHLADWRAKDSAKKKEMQAEEYEQRARSRAGKSAGTRRR